MLLIELQTSSHLPAWSSCHQVEQHQYFSAQPHAPNAAESAHTYPNSAIRHGTRTATWDLRSRRFAGSLLKSSLCHGDSKTLRAVGLLDIARCAATACPTDHFLPPCFPPAACDPARGPSRVNTHRFHTEGHYFQSMGSSAQRRAGQQKQTTAANPNQYKPGAASGGQNRRRNTQVRPFLRTHRTSLQPCSGSAAPG